MSRTRKLLGLGIVVVLMGAVSPSAASAQSVRGSGLQYQSRAGDGFIYFDKFAVDAWLDRDGVAHGTMTWLGDVAFFPGTETGGPAVPWIIDVTDILFVGNTAFVAGTVVHSPNHNADYGLPVVITFTDNSGSGLPDAANGRPIDSGNIMIRP